MIASFQHKGLKLFYDKGNASKLQAAHVAKIRLILTRLDAAKNIADMNVPGYGLHQLTGNLAGCWAVKVSGNYRIIFRFIGEDAHDADYLDYH
ncbi:type II toxin-antitoxin system RelE/ParE family toxin [Flavitalea sp. BT771]|uniref:type II toxin-antitoxin system RelE/ParE family toxin n=1 Tax=Flavitalea sp. BT771 TaxID=3063329 RepID=UPI0026E12FF0|nr:type II toxin-antitoxin system RelE/ParE family toxin [Flavitalea sp. BT771]MDO6429653.1 type II toxin-antitoxin system RelE/ParE family toxin [Flavitalea sp. BT771]MDV6218219.1 type II toxin-antitoxin system RelE/ParE family toxin [Flavitalea sp. BT771]